MPVFMPHWPKPLGKRPIRLGLERVLKVLDRLGNPQKLLPPVIHVAGTNGKGSSIAFLNAILKSSGYKSHVYTSPHLVHFNERIVISGEQINDRQLYHMLEDVRQATRDDAITFFEGTTIAAILAFAKNKADFCLIETGMGGRIDATNVVDNPILCMITPIDYDHMDYLGNTLQKIAHEKAGIMKPGTTCIISKQHDLARYTLEEHAIKMRSPVFRYGFEWSAKPAENGIEFLCNQQKEIFKKPALFGDHQIINAGCAIAAATILANKFGYKNINFDSVNAGLICAKWPARLEKLEDKKNSLIKILPDGWEIYLDGAHNTSGARALANWLQNDKAHFILGMTRDKDTSGFLNSLKNNIRSLHVVCVQSEPRSQTTQELAEESKKRGIFCIQHQTIESAVRSIVDSDIKSKKILICGSLFLAKDVAAYSS
jgi:dihydrofolate synthase/folylpolyglutamate synthase